MRGVTIESVAMIGPSPVSGTALAAGKVARPVASAIPLTVRPPRKPDEIDGELKGMTDRIVAMIGELSQ